MIKLKFPAEGPLGLSMSGGGAKGAYTVGVLQYIVEVLNRRDFKMVYGTSTGALIGALFAAFVVTEDIKHFEDLKNIYRTVKQGDVLLNRHKIATGIAGEVGGLAAAVLGGSNSVYLADPLRDLVNRYMTQDLWNTIIEAGKKSEPFEVGFVVVDLQTGESKVISNITHPDPEVLSKAVVASASQPVFMPTVDVLNNNHQYVDGGLRDFSPVERLFESDVFNTIKGIVDISLQGDQTALNTQFNSVPDLLLRSLDIYQDSVFESDRRASQFWNALLKAREFMTRRDWNSFVMSLPKDLRKFVNNELEGKNYVEIMRMRPDRPLNIDALSFRQPKMKNLVRRGFQDAAKRIVTVAEDDDEETPEI